MSFEIAFTIPGIAVPKGRPRVVSRHGRAMAVTPDKTIVYENLVKSRAYEAMRQCGLKIETGALRADITIGVPIPKSWPKKHQEAARAGTLAPVSRPDLDNCIKAILDAMNEVVFKDDGQIVKLAVGKVYADTPSTFVHVYSTGQEVR